ncbi:MULTISPECIES: reverse transcriptase domain-containing protein [Lelliottia]
MHRSLQTRQWKFVCRTNIRGFNDHIRRAPLMRQIKRYVKDPLLLNLVYQYLHYSVEDGVEFYTPVKGICRGCALSPLLAGFCLLSMDTYFEAQRDIRYVRYMDDIVIFAPTRWRLRRAVRDLNVFFASGGYGQHPDKTFIGRTDRGFDWMGIQFTGSGATGIAPRALANHRERCRRLYEQAVWRGREWLRQRLSAYVKRWTIWRNSYLCNLPFYGSCWTKFVSLTAPLQGSSPTGTDASHTSPCSYHSRRRGQPWPPTRIAPRGSHQVIRTCPSGSPPTGALPGLPTRPWGP